MPKTQRCSQEADPQTRRVFLSLLYCRRRMDVSHCNRRDKFIPTPLSFASFFIRCPPALAQALPIVDQK